MDYVTTETQYDNKICHSCNAFHYKSTGFKFDSGRNGYKITNNINAKHHYSTLLITSTWARTGLTSTLTNIMTEIEDRFSAIFQLREIHSYSGVGTAIKKKCICLRCSDHLLLTTSTSSMLGYTPSNPLITRFSGL